MTLVVTMLALNGSALAVSPPPRPDSAFALLDYASLVGPAEQQRISIAQQAAFSSHDVPIMVVTIPGMAAYGGGVDIESFATEWFNQWRIGTLDGRGGGHNLGILLLVSVADRRARIELGTEWGRDWDSHSRWIMNRKIVPQFKNGNFAEGIAQGVEALADMADQRASGTSPGGTGSRFSDPQQYLQGEPISPLSPIPARLAKVMLVLGGLLIFASLFFPRYRKILFQLGIALIAIALILWVIIFIAAIFMKSRSGTHFGGSGGGFSGGGGGFSGGGGASGSW